MRLPRGLRASSAREICISFTLEEVSFLLPTSLPGATPDRSESYCVGGFAEEFCNFRGDSGSLNWSELCRSRPFQALVQEMKNENRRSGWRWILWLGNCPLLVPQGSFRRNRR